MILYSYRCIECGETFDKFVDSIDCRDNPCLYSCIECDGEIERSLSVNSFTVPEGACGNSGNGYSSYHGDSENYKAGRKLY